MTPFLTLKHRFKTLESVFAPERSLNTNWLPTLGCCYFFFFYSEDLSFENNDTNLFFI